MFSHLVVFSTDPDRPEAADQLVAGVEKYLRPIPGVELLHVGRMIPSARPVVRQDYQVALNLVFLDQAAHDAYQAHPLHREFVQQCQSWWRTIHIYDFA